MATQDPCEDFRVTTQKPQSSSEAHTPIRRFRAPDGLWQAYESVCKRVLQRDRSEDLLDHIVATVREHGNKAELEKLVAAEAEMAERRARKGGRPPKQGSA